MDQSKRRKRGRGRRAETMNFVYSGPFSPVGKIDGRIGRSFTDPEERYTPEGGGFTIEAALGSKVVGLLVAAFGRDGKKPAPRRRPRRPKAAKS